MATALCGPAAAENFNIPRGDLKAALDIYMKQSGATLMYADDEMKGVRTNGVKGALSPDDALTKILSGTGFALRHDASAIAIVRTRHNRQN